MVAASGLGRAKVDPLVVGVGCVVALVVAGRALAHAPDWLDWALDTLVDDLPRAAVAIWVGLLVWGALAMASPRLRESALPFGHLLVGPPWGRCAGRLWAVGIVGAGVLVLLPSAFVTVPHGLSSRVVPEGRLRDTSRSP